MTTKSQVSRKVLLGLTVCIAASLTYADESIESPFCEIFIDCIGCYTAIYTAQAQLDTSDRCKDLSQQSDPPGSVRIKYLPEEALDPVGVQCHEQGGGALLCEAYPLPETPGEFSYAWITSSGLSPLDALYSAWSPSRNYDCSGADQEMTVLVTSPRGTVGIVTIQLDCAQP